MDDQEPQTGLLVDLTEPEERRPKPVTPPNLEEQLRKMDLTIRKRRASSQLQRPEPESPTNFDDVPMISDEVFDFDLPALSTSSDSLEKETTAEDDDDEIFFGPVGHTEKCVAKVVEQEASPTKEEPEPTPLSAAELVQVFVEAQKVACLISAQGGEKKPTTPSLSFLTVSRVKEDVVQEAQRSGGRKRKGTFTLDDAEEDAEEAPPKKSGLERRGTFRVTKRKSTFTLSDPEDSEEPATSKPGHERKGTFNLDDVEAEKTNNKEVAPAKSAKEAGGKAIQRLSLPQAGKSLLQRNAVQRRSLRAPQGRSGIGSGIAGKGPLKATSTSTSTSSSSSTSTSPKETVETTEVKEPPKRLSGGLQRPSAVTSFLPRPGAGRGGPSGLKPPGARKSLNPPAPVTAKAPQVAAPAAPAPAPTQAVAAKPGLKGPMTKMQLLRPGQLQMRGTGLKAPTAVKGPLKATERLSGLKGPQQTRQPLTSHVNGVPEQKLPRKRPASPVRQSLEGTTPVKQDKNVQPKRLMTGFQNLQTPPRKSSDSSNASTPSSTKRRSFLPTPGKTFTGPRRSSSSVSSIGSQDSMASPQLTRGRSPATRRSLASPQTRSSPMRTRPKIQHTPVNKENETRQPKRSIWSPIRRPKPLTREEELTQCTKRTALQYQ